jgi:hypothetical protein
MSFRKPVRPRDHRAPAYQQELNLDLDYLYHRHCISLFNAGNANCEQPRLAHLSLVAAYAAKIEEAERSQAPLALVR